MPYNLNRMPRKLIRPKQLTPEEIEKRLDWLAARYAETHDKKLMREIERLSRLLGRLKRKSNR